MVRFVDSGNFTSQALETISRAIYGAPRSCRLEVIRAHGGLADSTAIYLVDGAYILHVSPHSFPEAAAREVSAIRAIAPVLGSAGSAILPIVAEGNIGGVSFMAIPRVRPIRRSRFLGRIDRIRVRGEALSWVRSLAMLAERPSEAAGATFNHCLVALAETEGLVPEIAHVARDAASALADGRLEVGHVPMHGDLWVGNLMRAPDGSLRIIDWAGSQPRGYGVYDLMRLGGSLGVSHAVMRRELAILADALGGREALKTHLAAALGHYAANLGYFPKERFVAMADHMWREFSRLA